MSIWSYNDEIQEIDTLTFLINRDECFFCRSKNLEPIDFYEGPSIWHRLTNSISSREFSYGELVCNNCGWWIKSASTTITLGEKYKVVKGCSAGRLKNLDLEDITVPLDEVNNYLIAKYEDRHKMNWALLEDLVGSVFRNLGYDVIVTGRSNDGGIDAILNNSSNKKIGVQVKKYKNNIKAEQIRALAGALVVNGITEGVFVTTSNFQPSAIKTADILNEKGLPIMLINAKRFYEALQITNKATWANGNRQNMKLKLLSVKSY